MMHEPWKFAGLGPGLTPLAEERESNGGLSGVRQFVQSLSGKFVSALSVFALVLPTFILMSLGVSVSAQPAGIPTWAVVEFETKNQAPSALGKVAQEALINELSKTQKYDVLSPETVDRVAQNLGYQQPLTNRTQVMRLAQELRVGTIVTGEVVNSRVIAANGGRRADVLMRTVIWDVASGEQVNGAAVQQSSGVRAGEVSDETLLAEALGNSSYDSVSAIQKNTLPVATILNTVDRKALINQGSRTGFVQGQQVIILRGREQVATGAVISVEPDQAFVQVKSQTKGIQPGDKVRAVFIVPVLDAKWSASGTPRTVQGKRGGSNSGLISVLLVVGLVAVLAGGGGGGSNGSLRDVKAEATTTVAGNPAVKVSWGIDGFSLGFENQRQFQIWRSDVPATPIAVVPGSSRFYLDDGITGAGEWSEGLPSNGSNCVGDDSYAEVEAAPTPVTVGQPVQYRVVFVFRRENSDNPGATAGSTSGSSSGSGSGGSTSGSGSGGFGRPRGGEIAVNENYAFRQVGGDGGSTSGSTSGSTTGSDGGGELEYCYFQTAQVPTKTVTPVNPPRPIAPSDNAVISVAPTFSVSTARGSNNGIVLQYCLQLSTSPSFPNNSTTRTVLTWTGPTGVANVNTPRPITEALSLFPGEQTIWWRIGGRNQADQPGPELNGGQRFVFGPTFRFQRPVTPPAP
jgi:hypothetical protein